MTTCLITGASGQDGYYLSSILLAAGHEVHGTVRPGGKIEVAGVAVHEIDFGEEGAAGDLIRELVPDVVYNLAAVSSVFQSWQQPELTSRINGGLVAELLHAAHGLQQSAARRVRFVQATSAEIFGAPEESPQTERTPVRPTSPYGAAKAYAHHLVGVYRGAGLFASSCVLYNHESPRRPETFVSRKISAGVARIAAGQQATLELGNLSARRDWGWAPDYAAALKAAAEADSPDDFVIASGSSHSVEEFVAVAFARVGITDWRDLVVVRPEYLRPSDSPEQVGDAARARDTLGWRPSRDFESIVNAMVDSDVAMLAQH